MGADLEKRLNYSADAKKFENYVEYNIIVTTSNNESNCVPSLPCKKFDIDKNVQNIAKFIKYY